MMKMATGSLKQAIKRAIISLLFHSQPKIVVASTGRAGSTMLFNAIAEGIVFQKLHIRPGSGLANILKRIITGYVDRIATLPKESCLVCKTHDTCEHPPSMDVKYVFVYGDPLESAMSVDQMVQKEGLQWFELHQYHLKATGSYSDLYKKDVLNYQQQLESWMSHRRTNIFCIDYEDLWEKEGDLSSFLGFKVQLPPRQPRKIKPEPDVIDQDTFARLRELKRQIKISYQARNRY